MKQNIFKLLCMTFCIIASMNAMAQQTSLTIDNQAPGWLSSKIGYSDQQTLEELKVTGYINGTDINFLVQLQNDQKLRSLDLSDVNIVKGGEKVFLHGDSYTYDVSITEDNYFYPYLFLPFTNLQKLSTPKALKPDPTEHVCVNADTVILNCQSNRIGVNRSFWPMSSSHLPSYKINVLEIAEGIDSVSIYGSHVTYGAVSWDMEKLVLPSTLKKLANVIIEGGNIVSYVEHPENMSISGTTYRGPYGTNTTFQLEGDTIFIPQGTTERYKNSRFRNMKVFIEMTAPGGDENSETIELASARELTDFAARVNAGETSLRAVLKADIDLTEINSSWIPIGSEDVPYSGIFDGQGHTITNFEYTATSDCNGLFGVINNATVKNFSINGTLTSQKDWNGVVGRADDASVVSGIHSSLTINVSNCAAHTGGVVGGSNNFSSRNHTVLVEGCEYSGTLRHSGEGDCQAGIIGYTYAGGVKNCIFSGTIIGENSRYSGILGYCKYPDFIGVQNCLSVGKIVADASCTTAAAIIGDWNGSATVNVKNNYYCLQEGSTTIIGIGNNTSNCEAPHEVNAEQLASGEVCYALNGDQTEINWYQTLGNDNYPVLDKSHLQVKFIDGSYINDNLYTITFDSDGGSPIESITQNYGTTITPPEGPTKEGYTFMGWEPAIPETMPVGGLTCVAQWQINSYNLIYIVDGVEYSRSEVEYGTTITPLETPTKEGYTFSGWSYIPATMPATEVRVFGSFTINSYTLTYMVDGEEYKTLTLVYGSDIVPEEEPTKEGYTFSGWSEIPETMPANDVVVTGSFTANSYTLLYMVDGEEYKTAPVPYGTALTPEEEPTKEGYTFSGWSEIPETMPAHDVTVTGSFSVNSYTLTYKIDGKVYKMYSVAYGTSLTPEPAPVKKGMTFSGWSNVPGTMPARNVTITGTYSWSKETIGGVVYEVADTLNNYVAIVDYEGTDGEAELLPYIEIGGDIYEVRSIADSVLPKTITIQTSVGRLLLWLWTNGYESIKETETGRDLSAPEVALVAKTASSLSLSFVNDYPELSETLIVQGATVEKGEKGYEVALKGLEPDNLYEGLASLTLTYEDASYTKSYSFRTDPLTLTTLQPKIVSLGNAIVAAETNLDDGEGKVGFEWRRTEWTDEFDSRFGAAYLYQGVMEGYIRNLNVDKLWKFRPYYTSGAGNTYYGDWKGMDPSDYSFFEPTVHTYTPFISLDNIVELIGYVMRGTDNVTIQGFIYWNITISSSSRRNAKGVPEDAMVVEAEGHVMKATLDGLEGDTEYCCMAFAKTESGETFYGEPQMFRTNFDPDGIKEIENGELKVESSDEEWYDLSGRKLDKPQRGINIIRRADGTTRKVLIK